MSTSQQPYGLRPFAQNAAAQAAPEAIDGAIPSGYASAIYFNSPVTLATTGTLAVATTTSLLCGSFQGCRYKPDSTSLTVESQYWPASATYVAGSMTAWVVGYTDNNVRYRMQANGTLASTAIGDQAALVNPSSGTNQFSLASLNSSLVGAGSTGQLRILNLYPSVNNSWGDSYTDVVVQIAGHVFYPQATAI